MSGVIVFIYLFDLQRCNSELGQNTEFICLQVLDFFKTRIELQYPVVEAGNLDKFQIAHGQQEAFMKDRGANVVGREETLQEVISINCLSQTRRHR